MVGSGSALAKEGALQPHEDDKYTHNAHGLRSTRAGQAVKHNARADCWAQAEARLPQPRVRHRHLERGRSHDVCMLGYLALDKKGGIE